MNTHSVTGSITAFLQTHLGRILIIAGLILLIQLMMSLSSAADTGEPVVKEQLKQHVNAISEEEKRKIVMGLPHHAH